MPIIGSSASQSGRVPGVPTSVSATAGNTQATVSFTVPAYAGKGAATYTAISSPGNITATGTSPITVTGLSNGTAYTFTVRATSSTGQTATSSASSSVTPVNPVSVVTGGTLTEDATYYYRTFTANGSLGISGAALSCDYVLVAGGGGGGSSSFFNNITDGGGGGGGGIGGAGQTGYPANGGGAGTYLGTSYSGGGGGGTYRNGGGQGSNGGGVAAGGNGGARVGGPAVGASAGSGGEVRIRYLKTAV